MMRDEGRRGNMVNRPPEMNPFEFIAMATLRTAQLIRGCVPRVPSGHKFTTTAQLEIIAGQILKLPQPPPLPPQFVPVRPASEVE